MSASEVVVVDYRAGNLPSVVRALKVLGVIPEITSDPDTVRSGAKIVLPGVGHFAATQFLKDRGLTEAIRSRIGQGVPFLGICVGMQWLFAGSTEAPDTAGGGLLTGCCERFETGEKVPHVGWNSLSIKPTSRLMEGVAEGSYVYYSHAYRVMSQQDTVAVTEYGGLFAGAVECGNIMGVQFHPEKSGRVGLAILKNFLDM